MRRLVVGVGLFLAGITAACAGDATPFVEPTQTLIPPTATFTPSPEPPTTAQPTLPAPADIAGTISPIEPEATVSDSGDLLDVDPVASELAALAQRRIADELELPTRRVQIVEVTAYVWPDTSLGCPIPGETYTTQTVDGYRIVLSAGDNEYLFHTDFDRAIPCAAENEQLPETSED